MSQFRKYLEKTIKAVAEGKHINREEWHLRNEVFFQLIRKGMSVRAANNVMDFYI